MTDAQIAQAAHEISDSYMVSIGNTLKTWAGLSAAKKTEAEAIAAIFLADTDITTAQAQATTLAIAIAAGWKHAQREDEGAKVGPAIASYGNVTDIERNRLSIFRQSVISFAPYVLYEEPA